jgi:multicomponent Na+:H+ antiporter subunit B
MKPGVRLGIFLAAAAGFVALFGWGLAGLPAFGHYRGPYGDILNAICVPERHITDVVTAINFDFRGFDTLGEEFIMFASVMGVVLLLRLHSGERKEPPRDQAAARKVGAASDAVRILCVSLAGPVAVFGIYVVVHGQLTPGGGFQGGVVLASAPLLLYLAGEFRMLRRIAPHWLVEVSEAVGAGGYAVIGALGLFSHAAFLRNVLPLGTKGDVFSGGTVALIDLAVGLEVSAGFLLLLITFLQETLEIRRVK